MRRDSAIRKRRIQKEKGRREPAFCFPQCSFFANKRSTKPKQMRIV